MPAAKELKHPMPICTLKGWGAAWDVLDRIDNDAQREALTDLVRHAGFQGAAALKFASQLARYYAGLSIDYPSPPARLKSGEAGMVERRVREGLKAHDRELFPFLRAKQL